MVISYYSTSLESEAGVKFEKQNMKTQGNEVEKQSIRELNLQVQGGTQRGRSHDDEA